MCESTYLFLIKDMTVRQTIESKLREIYEVYNLKNKYGEWLVWEER